MKNVVLIISLYISSFSVFAQRESQKDTLKINPKYKEIEDILKTDLPHHQQERNIAENSNKTIIRICAPSRANMIAPLTIVKYGKKEYISKDSQRNWILNIINPNDISKIDILKDEEIIKKYNDDVKNGVIIVTIKDEKADKFAKALRQRKKDFRKLKKD